MNNSVQRRYCLLTGCLLLAVLLAAQEPALRIPVSHKNKIRDLVYDPAGKIIATIAEQDHEVKLWEIRTSRLLYTLSGHLAPVNSVAFSRDGKKLLTTSSDSSFCIWEVENGKMLHRVMAHKAATEMGIFSPDDSKLITVSPDKTMKIWDAASVALLQQIAVRRPTFVTQKERQRQMMMHGNLLLVPAGNITELYQFRPDSIVKKMELKSKQTVFSPDGDFILSGENTGSINVYDSRNFSLKISLKEHQKEITKIEFSPDGKKMLCCARDGMSTVWEFPSFKKMRTLSTNYFDYELADLSPDGKLFACKAKGAANDRVMILDIQSATVLQSIMAPAARMTFTGANRLLLILKDRIQVWNPLTGVLETEIVQSTENRGSLYRYKVNEEGTMLILQVNYPASELKVFSLQSGQQLAMLTSDLTDMKDFEFSGDGNNILLIGNGGMASENKIWSFKSQSQVQEYGNIAVSGIKGKEAFVEKRNPFRVLVKDYASGRITDSVDLKKIVPDFKEPKEIVLSADGKLLVSLHAGQRSFRFGREILIYDLAGKKKILEINQDLYLQHAVFSPSGNLLLLADEKWSYAELWSLKLGRRLISFSPDNRRSLPLRITKNEQYLIAANTVYDLNSGKEVFFHNADMGTNDISNAGFYNNEIVYTSAARGISFWSLGQLRLLSTVWGNDGKNIQIKNTFISTATGSILLQKSTDEIGIWTFGQSEQMGALARVNASLQSFVFDSTAATFLLVNRYSKRVKLFDAVKAEELNAFEMTAAPGDNSPVLYQLPDKKRVVTTGGEIVQLWDISKSGALLSVGKADANFSFPPFVTFNREKSRALITYGRYPLFHMMDLQREKLLYSGAYRAGNFHAMKPAFSPDGSVFIITSEDSLTAFKTSTGERLYSWAVKFDGQFSNAQHIIGVQFSPDGEHFFVFVDEIGKSTLTRHRASDGQPAALLKRYTQVTQGRQMEFSFSANNKILYLSTLPGSAFDISSGKEVFPEGQTDFTFREISKDRKLTLLTGSGDALSVYDASSLQRKSLIPERASRLKQSRFSPDSKKLFTSTGSGIVKQWDTQTGQLEQQFINMDLDGDLFTLKNNRYIVSRGEHAVTFFDNKNGTEICRYVFFDAGQVVILPSGYYMADKENLKKLYYVKGLQTIGFEQLDVRFNRPDKVLPVIASIFEKENNMIHAYRQAWLKRVRKLGIDTSQFQTGYAVPEAEIINRTSISINQSTGKLAIRIKAKDNFFALDRLNILVNEAPLYGMRGLDIMRKNRKELDTTINIPLSTGKNQISVSVTNVNGLENYRSPLFVNYSPAPGTVPEEKLYFIGIGIDEFTDKKYNLQYSGKDIRDLARKLKEKYGRAIVIDTFFNQQVTVQQIKGIKNKLAQTSVNDKVILAYSGHGLLSKDFDYYLSTYTVNFDQPEQNGLPYDELENLLDSIPARRKLMLIDACHSGEVDKEEMTRITEASDSLQQKGTKGGKPTYTGKTTLGMKNSFELMQSLFVNVGKSTGATVISAAAGTQFALERGDLKNGVFTYSILEAMNKYPSIKISELRKIVGERVEELTNGLQKPTSRNETILADWVL